MIGLVLAAAIVVVIYAVVLGPLLWLVVRAARQFSVLEERREVYGGLVTSSFVGALAALALTSGIGVRGGLLAWLVFVLVCGLVIRLPAVIGIVQIVAAASVPSIVLVLAALAVYGLPLWIGGAVGEAISHSGPTTEPPSPNRVMTLTLFVGGVSVPAIAAASYSRSTLVQHLTTVMQLDSARLKQIEDSLSAIVRIGAIVAAVFIYVRS